MTLAELLTLLEDDREVVETLIAEGMLTSPIERCYDDEEVEQARVARVLLRELEVNPAGVQVILHMRGQIVALRRQMIDVLTELHEAGGGREGGGQRGRLMRSGPRGFTAPRGPGRVATWSYGAAA